MALLQELLKLVHDLRGTLTAWAGDMGPWLSVALFAIIFCETGLVVTPFLPGDSLLFTLGALEATASGWPLRWQFVAPLLIVAGVLGDAVNYAIGRRFGHALFTREDSKVFNKKHLVRAQRFYEKYGGKTIILARFVPIVRTFAPFVAGMGDMTYRRFAAFNVVGAVLWVGLLYACGIWFGGLGWVKDHFEAVVVAIVVVSVLPAVFEGWRARNEAMRTKEPPPAGPA